MKNIFIFFIVIFPVFSCYGQDSQSIFLGKDKIALRDSAKNNVEKLLGEPESIQFFEKGGEDFFWKNFTVCSYDDKKLSFHYDQNDAVIRITINVEYFGDVCFLGKDIKSIMREDILSFINKYEGRNVLRGVYVSDKFISFDCIFGNMNPTITYSFWVDTRSKITWIDLYYDSPWY